MATAESPMGDAKKVADTAQSAAGFAQKLKQIIKAIKAVRMAMTSATGVGALANAALLLKDKIQKYRKQIAAAVAGAIGLYLYLLYLLWLKFIGALAGLAFGLVTGLPLLAIPVAGPFLYAGWVGFWTVKGFLDPTGTIHLATHPWQIVTKPWNWASNQFSNIGGGIKGGAETAVTGTGNAISGVASTAGSFVTGIASSVWGGISSAAGSAWGFVSTGFNAVTGAFVSGGSAVAGTMATVGVGGTMATVFTGTILTTTMTNVAYSTDQRDEMEEFENIAPGDNDFFTLEKTASPERLGAPGDDITFTIRLTAKDQAITSVGFIENFRFTNGTTETPLTNPSPTCTTPIAAGSTCTFTFTQNTFLLPNNITLINSVAVSATMADGTTETDTTSVTVPIGASPAGCPSGWPASGPITQGPDGGTSHGPGGLEAIDIGKGAVYGDPIYSTFKGVVTQIWHREGNETHDKRVEIQPINCPGLSYAGYWHNDEITVTEGQTVEKGQIVARSGAYLGSAGLAPHLHYQFNPREGPIDMQEPYIPDDSFGRNCNNGSGCGVTATAP